MHLKNPFVVLLILTSVLLVSAFYIYKSLIQPAGAISLKYEETSQSINAAETNMQVVVIAAENLKVSFFGAAFHVNYNPQIHTYDHFTLGDYFSPQDDPIVLVNTLNNQGNTAKINETFQPATDPSGAKIIETFQPATDPSGAKIIVGISLKRGQLIKKSEGTLLKLHFKNAKRANITSGIPETPQDLNTGRLFNFSNTVFSTFEKERKDVKNITFYP